MNSFLRNYESAYKSTAANTMQVAEGRYAAQTIIIQWIYGLYFNADEHWPTGYGFHLNV